jgi:hypothetical protein
MANLGRDAAEVVAELRAAIQKELLRQFLLQIIVL